MSVRTSATRSKPLSASQRPIVQAIGVRGPLSSLSVACRAALQRRLPARSLSVLLKFAGRIGSLPGSHAW
jgi:hypothetical protein